MLLDERQQLAIQLGVPDTGNAEIDSLIRESNRIKLMNQIAANLAVHRAPGVMGLEAHTVQGIAEAAAYLAGTVHGE